MAWVALNCPQCSAPLPRVAIWRSVKCPSCGALITRTESIVTRDSFRQALIRARQNFGFVDGGVLCCGERYHLMQLVGNGDISQVYVAQRIGILPYLVTIKLSSAPTAAAHYAREAQVLRELQASGGAFSHRFPGVVAVGAVEEGDNARCALVLRHPNGYWGSLAALSEHFSRGIDPRHAVWIWRRMLEVLSFVHRYGWSHGDVRPEHALVHPQDHGVLLIGWGSAQKGADAKERGKDLLRSARVVIVLLSGAGGSGAVPTQVPTELAELLTQASQDEEFCRTQGAEGLDALLRAAAKAAFGPPAFVPLTI